jgi:hypothetical protein
LYAVTLTELKAVMKCTKRTKWCSEQNLSESKARDDDFQEVKRRKRHISNNTSKAAKNATKLVPTSAAEKLLQKAVLTRNFLAPLRTTDMDKGTTGAQNILPEQEAPRKPGRQPSIMMTSITNLIRLQNPKYTKWNPYHNKRNSRLFSHKIQSKEKQSSLFYLLPKFRKTYKGSNPSPAPRHAGERYFQQPWGLRLQHHQLETNVGHSTATNGETHVEPLPVFLVTLARNIKSKGVFKLNSLNHIINRAQIGLMECYNCQNMAICGPTASSPLDVCGEVVADCIGNALNLRRAVEIAP